MLPIIIIALTILFAVTILFYVYFKCINVSDATARKIEVIGYVLLVCAIIWEFVFKNIDMNDFFISESYYTVEKINYIYILLEKICQKLGVEASGTSKFFSLKTSDYLNTQLLITNVIEAIVQVLSTVCIGIGRLQELKNGKK